MSISLIVAFDQKTRGIGANNKLLWRLSSDLKRFKKLTTGKAMIMGRKTFESIGKVLPGRSSIILTRNPQSYQKKIDELNLSEVDRKNCYVFKSLDEAIKFCSSTLEKDIIICGGGEIYKEVLNKEIVDTLFLTEIIGAHSKYKFDTFFPEILNESKWGIYAEEKIPQDKKNELISTFKVLKKI